MQSEREIVGMTRGGQVRDMFAMLAHNTPIEPLPLSEQQNLEKILLHVADVYMTVNREKRFRLMHEALVRGFEGNSYLLAVGLPYIPALWNAIKDVVMAVEHG